MERDPDEFEISMHGPPPGSPGHLYSCCPEQLIKDGQCKSCGKVFDEELAISTKEAHWHKLKCQIGSRPKDICPICGGSGVHYEGVIGSDPHVESAPCPVCVRCCETCDWVLMDDNGLTGHCPKHDMQVEYDYICNLFKPQEV